MDLSQTLLMENIVLDIALNTFKAWKLIKGFKIYRLAKESCCMINLLNPLSNFYKLKK